ncbi:MAG TPA: LuxR C-terminal-related transcriptional regulator [Longimicrobiales bacterium]|nr:LuxR C-terminal-related transcriptional regulator [Longimicrobiales bacterium]
MTPMPLLDRARAAYEGRSWADAFSGFSAADSQNPLDAEDLIRLATAALLIGRAQDFTSSLDRAHRAHLEAGNAARAARCAFWIGFRQASEGDIGQATGWFARARRLLEREPDECVEHGYLLLPLVHQHMATRDYDAARQAAAEAVRIAGTYGDPELHALAVHFQGRALLEQARLDEGLALLDESMVTVATGDLSPQVTGLIYCSMIGACRRIHALGRAHEWTVALQAWCDQQPTMISYTGQCLAYRAEIMQLRGAWDEALAEAQRAVERGEQASDRAAVAQAHYQQGEVHRLRGDFAAAEESYRNASRWGREPQPGYALLRLAQGNVEAARAGIRRVLAETHDKLHRARMLPACVEISLSAGEVEDAARACRELEEAASGCDASIHRTVVAHACGAFELARGNTAEALVRLRGALSGWQELHAVWQVARVRVLLALACRAMGDVDAAGLELDAAVAAFSRLGAAPDIDRIERLRLTPSEPVAAPAGKERAVAAGGPRHGLTPRELEVLALVATGRTNRAIADELVISEKTVARHVSNIFAKLPVTSRAGATAWAYEHDLVPAHD